MVINLKNKLFGVAYKNTKIPYLKDSDSLRGESNKRTTGKYPCMLYRNSDRHITYVELDSNLIPQDSIMREYRGIYQHILGLDTEGKLYTIKPQDSTETNDTPQSLMVILSKMRILVIKAFPLGKDLIKMFKYGLLILFSFFEVIVLFLIFANLLGG